MIAARHLWQHMSVAGMCCLALTGCGPKPATSDPVAAKELLTQALTAWKEGKKPDDLKAQSPPVYVGDNRWASGAKLMDFALVGDGEFHQSSVRIGVRMKTDKDAKPREVFYWVSTSPANSITLAE